MMADFQNRLIFRIFSVFSNGFLHRTTFKRFVEWILTCFLEFKFLTQSDDFAKAIGFACMMADIQNGLISRIFGVFSSRFSHRRTLNHF